MSWEERFSAAVSAAERAWWAAEDAAHQASKAAAGDDASLVAALTAAVSAASRSWLRAIRARRHLSAIDMAEADRLESAACAARSGRSWLRAARRAARSGDAAGARAAAIVAHDDLSWAAIRAEGAARMLTDIIRWGPI
jgi:hypothetical protein